MFAQSGTRLILNMFGQNVDYTIHSIMSRVVRDRVLEELS